MPEGRPPNARVIAILALVGGSDLVLGVVLGVVGAIQRNLVLGIVGGSFAFGGAAVLVVAARMNARYRSRH